MAIFDVIGQQGTTGEKLTDTLSAIITDITTLADAKSAAAAYFPATLGLNGLTNITTREIGWHVWEATAEYAMPPASGGGSGGGGGGYNFSISLDFAAATQHITCAREHIDTFGVIGDANPPDHGGAIGVNGDNVDGCDILVPQATWQEQYSFTSSSITDAYLMAVHDLVGSTNAQPFRGRPADSVLFTGASGQYSSQSANVFDMTFRFAYSKNVEGVSIGDIDLVHKKGWEYLWVEYVRSVNDAGTKRIAKPIAVHIERVYDSASFSTLGIGT